LFFFSPEHNLQALLAENHHSWSNAAKPAPTDVKLPTTEPFILLKIQGLDYGFSLVPWHGSCFSFCEIFILHPGLKK